MENFAQYLTDDCSIRQFKRKIKQLSDLSDSHTAILDNSWKAFSFLA